MNAAQAELDARLRRLRSSASTYQRTIAECEADGQPRKAEPYRLGLELLQVQQAVILDHQRMTAQIGAVQLALARTAFGAPGAPRAPRRGHVGPTRRTAGPRRSTSSRGSPSEDPALGDEPPGHRQVAP